MANMVKVEHLSHRYNERWAIRDINFEIAREGIVGLLGSNGAGKSTTMNIICGVLRQTEGEVFINGVSLRERPVEAKRQVGFLPQKPPLYPDFTVEEYLTYCADLRMVEKSKIKQSVATAAERCGVTHFRERLLKNLSGGYQQRVGIAQAIVHDPAFVVLDEPTNGLDPNQIVEVRHLIRDIARERSVLLSTHILSEVRATCDEIKMIEQGELVFAGTVDAFDNYIAPNTLLLTLQQPPPPADLLAIEGVGEVKELGGPRLRLGFDGDAATARRVAERCVAADWGLIEITIEKSSMDAVFARLSRKSNN
ncbi:MAG: ABC transporter ATP-binding protein [Odoribacteraceae bacterium]|jgi:ABC-2 type transport system ATP-binding protein|nr:ABC transporter ATP-binding protein [Odoribacteraceae bacterium]